MKRTAVILACASALFAGASSVDTLRGQAAHTPAPTHVDPGDGGVPVVVYCDVYGLFGSPRVVYLLPWLIPLGRC